MKRLSSWCIQICACFLLLATANAQAADKKADPTGTWTWSTPGRDGGQARETTLKLKLEGDKLTGTITGRRDTETKIENAKMAADEITFDVKREFQGNTVVTKYKGKITGDEIKGKTIRERDGEPVEREWTAKRKKDEKKPA